MSLGGIMQKIFIFQLFLFLTLLSGTTVESELGIDIGLNSTQNKRNFKFKNPTVGITYQDDRFLVMPRFDLDYVDVKNDYASSFIKGSINAVYENKNMNYTIPYVLMGIGYEHVNGATKDVFDSHPFIQGGVGIGINLEQGYKLKFEGKMLQVLSSSQEGNEAIVTVGITMPLNYNYPLYMKQSTRVIRKVRVLPKVKVVPIIVQPPKTKFIYIKNNECSIKIDKPDFDRDGVEDRLDQCPATPCNFRVDRYGCPIKTTLKIHFKTNSDKIESTSIGKIDIFADFLLKNRGSFVKIVGHTDSRGSDKHNMELSLARANSVMKALIARGVSVARLSIEGRGESEPIASNKTEEGRAINRRIEAILSYPKRGRI